jgi:drug/metabolite transporter (DMT)-like permease
MSSTVRTLQPCLTEVKKSSLVLMVVPVDYERVPTPTDQIRAALAAAVTIVLWASAFVVIRSSGAHLSPGAMALARVGVAAAVLTPLALRGARPLLPRGRVVLPVLGYGALWFAGYNIALNAAERHVDAGTAALLVNVAPVLIAVGGALALGEGFSRPLFVGCAIAFAGVALMGGGAGGDSDTLGIMLGLVAAVLYAASVLLQKVSLRSLDPLRATWLGCVVGTVVTLPFAPDLAREVQSAPAAALAGAAYLGAFPTAVAFTTWAYALRRMPAGRLGPLGYLVTVLSVLLSWLFLGEVPTGAALAGGAVCLVGVAVSRWRTRPQLVEAPKRNPEPGRSWPAAAAASAARSGHEG